ncbi:diguanylate phosphodiesterase [Listeria monocytogenes]|nr:diguanylate phosphodiesterase [Listeria monocytogenes]
MLYYLECTNFHMLFWKGEIFILNQKYQLLLQNEYYTKSGDLVKKEIVAIKKTKNLLEDLTTHLLCVTNQTEYGKFINWYEMEVKKVLQVYPNQHFIVKISFQQLYFRETMLLLENLQKDSRRITIELVGDSQISPNSKEHFSAEDSDAFLKGKLKMLRKWHYFISKHIESGAIEQTLIFTPYIDELKYSLTQKSKLLNNITELKFFLSFWKNWAELRFVDFLVLVDEKNEFVSYVLLPDELNVRCKMYENFGGMVSE